MNDHPDIGVSEAERQLVALNRIARIASEDLQLRPTLQRIVDALHEEFGWGFVALARVDRKQYRFVCAALYSDVPTEISVGSTRPLGAGLVGEVALTGETIDLDDVGGHGNFVDTLHGTRAELCVPVRHRGETIAVLNVESVQSGAFRGQRVLLETVAEQIAGALSAARLHAELRRRAELLAMMSEISRAALEVASFEQTLERIVRFLRERFWLELCGILLANDDGELTLRAWDGDLDDPASRQTIGPLDTGVVQRAFRTGQVQFLADTSLDPEYVVVNARVNSELAIPIRLQGRILGVLNLESGHPDSFNDSNREMLEALAAQVAGAIQLAGDGRRLAELNRAMEQRTLELQSANAQLRLANGALERLAQRDGLTGVANRRYFDTRLTALWEQCAQARRPLALLLFDLDHFKPYNDHYGHLAGDDCLRKVALAVSAGLREDGEPLARYGGEEFAVLLPGYGAAQAQVLGESLLDRVRLLALAHERSPLQRVSLSVGVAALAPDPSLAPQTLVAQADRGLYAAKAAGRNCLRLVED